MGPTPPGTGVTAPAIFFYIIIIYISCQFRLSVSICGQSVHAHIDYNGTLLDPIFFNQLARPTAATSISARAHSSASPWVREWAIVTVQFSRSNIAAMGFSDNIRAADHDRTLP